MKLAYLPSDFYNERVDEQGRRYTLDALVLHTTQGTDSRTWLTKTGNVSANELIRREGDEAVAYLMVGESFAAWHAGDVVGVPTTPLYEAHDRANPNLWTYGFEIEGYAAGPVDPLQLECVVSRIRDVRSRHGNVPLIDHRELAPGNRTDPGIWRSAIDAALEDEVASLSPEDKAYIEAKFTELYGVLYALERRQLRGQDALNPDNRPIVAGELVNQQIAR